MHKLVALLAEFLSNFRDLGLLIFRLGIGGMFCWHGWPKIAGGMEYWSEIGRAVGPLGIQYAPVFWGFMSGFAEFVGGLFFAIGYLYRPVCILLIVNMFVAFTSQMAGGKGLLKAAQSFEDGFSFIGALFVGPGKYSVDHGLGLEEPRRGFF